MGSVIPIRPELRIFKKPNRDRWLALRKTVTSSTDMGPIAGLTKYGNTRFSLYHEKRGTLEDSFEPNKRSRAGLVMEFGISKLVAEDLGARIVRLADFYVSGTMGASFDYEIDDPNHELHGWICEIKNVDYMIFKDQWDEDEHRNPVPPDHITIQIQHQLEVSGRPGCVLGVLVGGNDHKIIKIARDEGFGAGLRVISDAFWSDIENDIEPEVIAEDSSIVPLVYQEVDPNRVYDATRDDVISKKLADHKILKGRIDELEALRGKLKAEVLLEIGEAAKVFGMDGYTLDAGYTRANEGKLITEDMVGNLTGVRKGFRRFTVRKAKVGK